jgi:hypothetical protein
LLDLVEGSDDSDPDLMTRLAERRAERKQLEDRLEALRRHADQMPQEPTEAWVTEQLLNLRQLLSSGVPAAAFALRDLVGGQITVEEVQRPGRKRHFLRGQFTAQVRSLLAAVGMQGAVPEPTLNEPGETITLDFLAPDPRDALAERVKALWDQDVEHKDIAVQMNLHRSQVTGLLKHWSELHGEKLLDGRTRRGERARKNLGPPRAREIADKVMELFDQGLLYEEICKQLGCTRDTLIAAIKYWHESRGLPVPDGRERRKFLERKVSRPRNPHSTDGADAA